MHEEPFNLYPPEDSMVLLSGAPFAESAIANGPKEPPMQPVSSGMPEVSRKPIQEVRTKFPETWIWNILDSSEDGVAKLTKTVPDTITSWVISGFSLNPEYGLALSTDPAKVRVFRPFFISLNLPYSVKRGESVVVPVNVFNYLDQEVTTNVTLHNPAGWFSFASGAEKKSKREVETSRTKIITVGPNSAGSADFLIKPEKIGYMEVKATATSSMAGDGVSRKLLVKPEGITQYKTKGVLLDLRDKREFKKDVELAIPDDIVPDSAMIEVSAVGDLLGSALDNLDKLIRQPYGCGEQNMLNFVPNIVILDYLKNSKQLTKNIESKALAYLDMGYQRELTYKHDDNSYSAFGKSDESGSTWLTAFVAKSFKQAKKFTNIEDSAIIEPLRWIASKQNENGSFSEVGHVSHKAMQGGGSGGLALTAYVLTAFVESLDMTNEFKENIDKTVKYLEDQIAKGSADVYSTAVAAYALGLADLPSKEKAFQLMESKAINDGDLKHWENEKEKDAKEEKKKYSWEEDISNAINVEITAYAMLSYLQRNMTAEAIPILKWLLSQQNSHGGFASTQDTVVALGAIGKLAKELSGNGKDLTIKFNYPPGGSTELKVNDENSLLYQKAELPSRKVRQVSIDAKGTGFAVVQISYRYNVNKKGAVPAFKLNIQTDDSSTKDHLLLNICASYTAGKESNMAVMEVTLPSGFTIDEDGIKALRVTPRVKKVETKEENTLVVLYFDKVTTEDVCVPVSAYKTFRVAKQKPVPVTVYDYYDTTKKATDFYVPKPSSICDICEGDDCKNCDNDV
uniref:CD109 antigen n=1 Tax=Lygus hesperus TaxID=30085 RepID=A0A0A9X507_LYGHE